MRQLNSSDDNRFDLFETNSDKHFGYVHFIYGNGGYDVVHNYSTNLESLMKPIMAYADKVHTESFKDLPPALRKQMKKDAELATKDAEVANRAQAAKREMSLANEAVKEQFWPRFEAAAKRSDRNAALEIYGRMPETAIKDQAKKRLIAMNQPKPALV